MLHSLFLKLKMTQKILCVTANDCSFQLLAHVYQQTPWADVEIVHGFNTGSGKRMLNRHKDISLVLIEEDAFRVNGSELATEVKKSNPSTPVVGFTEGREFKSRLEELNYEYGGSTIIDSDLEEIAK